MQHPRHLVTALLLLGSLALPSSSAALDVGNEIWMGAGFSWPDYEDQVMACERCGFGLIFARHVGLGISAQADRDRIHYFGDASIYFPQFDMLEPYGRFQYGRRDDGDDAMGWCVGLRAGGDSIRAYLEFNQIFEPENNYGVTLGIAF